jgi:hypothetical protein
MPGSWRYVLQTSLSPATQTDSTLAKAVSIDSARFRRLFPNAHGALTARGADGQNIYADPTVDIVIVRLILIRRRSSHRSITLTSPSRRLRTDRPRPARQVFCV